MEIGQKKLHTGQWEIKYMIQNFMLQMVREVGMTSEENIPKEGNKESSKDKNQKPKEGVEEDNDVEESLWWL